MNESQLYVGFKIDAINHKLIMGKINDSEFVLEEI